MEFSEKVLEDIIWDNAQSPEGRKLLQERGLIISGMMFRQVDLGCYGRADLITVEYTPACQIVEVVVYELKKGCINVSALMQAARYVKALKRHGLYYANIECDIEFSICLIGDSMDTNGDFAFLYNESDNVEIYTYEFNLSGLFFRLEGKDWGRTNESLNKETASMLTDYLKDQIKEAENDDTDK